MRPSTCLALVLASLLAQVTWAQPAMISKPSMSAAASPLMLSSEFRHAADIVFTVTTGSGASVRPLCPPAVIHPPTGSQQVACGAVVPGSSITVTVRASDIDRCAGLTGLSLQTCAGRYSGGTCIGGMSQGCRYYGGRSPRSYVVTVPLVRPGTPVRLAWTANTSAVEWR